MEQELRERIAAYNAETEDLRNDVEAYCADMSVDLETRWKLFVDSKLGKIDDYLLDVEEFGFDYEDVFFEVRKYQHIDLVDMVSQMENWIEKYGTVTEENLPKHEKGKFGKFSHDGIAEFKEFLMDEFTKGGVMDW